ncbi:MAG: ABC transporter permease [Thermomicrobiales bacterium]|nr:ABC transporter permease [Thermomicrobiales bacterium]
MAAIEFANLPAQAQLVKKRRITPRRVLTSALKWKTFSIGLVILIGFILAAIFAGQIASHDPAKPDYKALLQSPGSGHLFGTDDKGRDIFTRVVYGSRVSIKIATISVGLAALIGLPLGMAAGYLGGWLDAFISRLLDAMFAFPVILMAIAILTITGASQRGAIIAIGLIAAPEFARVSRSAVVTERENEYVTAARSIGASTPRIIVRQILPNTMGPLVVLISLGFAFAILNETALSFLGLGAQPPTASWGADLAVGRRYIRDAPFMSIFPGLAIFFLVLALNLVGDGIRDIMDPRRRKV